MPTKTRYDSQRERRVPPHAPLAEIRSALGLTMDAVIDRMQEQGVTLSRGGLSAIENGHRGASTEVLAALGVSLGMKPTALTVSYEPRERREQVPA